MGCCRRVCAARAPLQANSPGSREAPCQGFSQSPRAGFLTNLMLTKAGRGSSHVLLLPRCSDEDAHKQQQTPARFSARESCVRNARSSGCKLSNSPRISAVLALRKLHTLQLPDCLPSVCSRRLKPQRLKTAPRYIQSCTVRGAHARGYAAR